MRIATIATGDELMAGNIADTNSAWISDRCWMLGHKVVLHLAVGDVEADIVMALQQASRIADVVIVSGGLGPTVDDITLAAASKCFDLPMVFHKKIWNGILSYFRRVKRSCSENNKQQAYLPKTALPLANIVGTAPGVQLDYSGVRYFFVPGVPKEMKSIFENSIFPYLKKDSETPGYFEKVLRCFGVPEATLDLMIRDIDLMGVNLSFRVSFPDVKIKLVARSKDIKQSKKLVANVTTKIRKILKDSIYGEDDESLEVVVGKLLLNKGYSVSTAESCTGGLIANRLTNISGASRYFDRGFITYSNEAKIRCLGVSKQILQKHGAVSRETALAMVKGVLDVSNSNVAIAVTGVAGPTGGTKNKPVGTVHIAIAGPSGICHQEFFFPRDRISFKELVASTAIDMLRKYL